MTYRAAIIGCGRVAWLMELDPLEVRPCTHMGAYLSIGQEYPGYDVKVAAACDTDAGRLRAFGEAFDVGRLYRHYKEMLEKEAPDIVSVCAYATERHGMVMGALDAGVKGIWCEKAFGTSLAEAAQMTREAARRGAAVIVSHMRRWSPEYRLARDLVESGRIGVLQSIVSHFSGSLLHTGTHAFDVLRWFGGDVDWVIGSLEGSNARFLWDSAEDVGGNAFIRFKNGVYATAHAESKDYFFFEFDIIGSHGRIRIGNNGVFGLYTTKDSTNYTGLKELYEDALPDFKKTNWWTGALKNLIDCMEGRAGNQSGPDDGLGALELALAVHESARRDGQRVYVPFESEITVRSR